MDPSVEDIFRQAKVQLEQAVMRSRLFRKTL
jgi:hypothetical protein